MLTRSKRTQSDLVTEYDVRCEELLRASIARAFPDHAFVGEEKGGLDSTKPTWYVDPIDGTTNFAHGHPFFCISLGLWDKGEPVAGVVHAPAMGVTYSAARGEGVERDGAPCRVSITDSIERSLLCTGFPKQSGAAPYRAFEALDRTTHGVRRCAAAALELSLVADGAYDAFWDEDLQAWDLAAGVLFVLEAGGRVSDAYGNPFALRNGTVLASNGAMHGPVLAALAHARALPASTGVT
jgi:myo-inositol-1(or 4)-monophosphatase